MFTRGVEVLVKLEHFSSMDFPGKYDAKKRREKNSLYNSFLI